MLIVVCGVAGSGKSTIGRLLARELGWTFYEGDDYHPEANRRKMRTGVALTDLDRGPWLAALRDLVSQVLAREENAVLACSALKKAHRDYLGGEGVEWVYLRGDPALIRERLRSRVGHFFDPDLLATQFETLEEPENALVVPIEEPPSAVVERIVRGLGLRPRAPPAR